MKIKPKTKIVLEVLCFIIFLLLIVFVVKNFSCPDDIESDNNPVSRLVSFVVNKYENWQKPVVKETVEIGNNLSQKLQENSAAGWQDNVNIWQDSWLKIEGFFINLFAKIKSIF